MEEADLESNEDSGDEEFVGREVQRMDRVIVRRTRTRRECERGEDQDGGIIRVRQSERR